jgi:hypothetical protein
MTPYSTIYFGLPELTFNDTFDAWQDICLKSGGLTSNHSPQETVQKKPDSLSAPTIRGPLVVGNDACRVDDLFIGAVVKIFANDGSSEVQVGGGTAIAKAVIYHINPPILEDCFYYARQYLCELESEPSDKEPSTKDVPAPWIDQPLCEGNKYVTVCNTVVLSTVKVFINGTQIGQAAGNGGCVKIALGDTTTLSMGQKVTAQQSVFDRSSPESPPVIVRPDGAPAYNPAIWNDSNVVRCNNCYNYGCDIQTNNFAQPGYAHNVSHSLTCPTVTYAAEADGLVVNKEKRCRDCSHLVALVIAPDNDGDGRNEDYHWYRLDNTGRWSHKMGGWPVTDRDNSGNLITNPETADRRVFIGDDFIRDYSMFCGYFCVDKDHVVISGWMSCD